MTLTDTSAINGTGNDLSNWLTGNSAANSLDGGTGADTLVGNGGNDRYIGGQGDDTLWSTLTASNDTYIWGKGQGADKVWEGGGTDQLQVLSGVTADQIWLCHVNNHLELSVIGTTDSFTIINWYSGASSQIESFKLADGKTLTAVNAQKLVDAMASFAPPAQGNDFAGQLPDDLGRHHRGQLDIKRAAATYR